MLVRVRKLEHAVEAAHGNKVLNVEEVCQLFDVSRMTVYKWRTGRGTKKARLPYTAFYYGERKLVIFDKEEVLKWAKENNTLFAEERAVRRREMNRERRLKRNVMLAHRVKRNYDNNEARIRKVRNGS